MSVQDSENRPPTRSGVKFEIHLGDKKPNASAPKRVSEQPMKASVSQEELEKKQKDAEERRRVSFCRQKLSAILNLYPYTLTTVPYSLQKEEQAKLDRIHQTEQETKRFCQATAPIIERIADGASDSKK